MASQSTIAPEVRVSELEAELQAKDSELRIVRERLRQSEEEKSRLERQLRLSSTQYTAQLEARIADLEAQNSRLRPLESAQFENERLKLELDHAMQLRTAFEEKFKETKVRLLSLERSDFAPESLQRENEDLRSALSALQADSDRVKSLERELSTLKACYDRLYEETRQEAAAYPQGETEETTETPRVAYQTPPALLTEPRFVAKSRATSEPQSSPASQMNSSKISAVSTASYCPSFLRCKKMGAKTIPAKKPCSRFLRLDTQKETFEGVDSDMT